MVEMGEDLLGKVWMTWRKRLIRERKEVRCNRKRDRLQTEGDIKGQDEDVILS